jgi:hypothetical protein
MISTSNKPGLTTLLFLANSAKNAVEICHIENKLIYIVAFREINVERGEYMNA